MNEEKMLELWDKAGGDIYAYADLVADHEREACLKLADSLGWVNVDHIRARGQE